MDKIKLGIAISLYDKFDELAVLHDIFRKNFDNKFYLYVCSNHQSAEKEIKKRNLEFDGFIQGTDIPYDKSMSNYDKRIAIVCRSTDTVQKSCSLALKNTEYVMHIHCDAWPLNEEKLLEHFKLIINSDYDFAFRGLGYSAQRADAPLGHVDDHFFIFNSKKAKENKLFEFNAIKLLPHKLTIHGIITLQLLSKIGMDGILFYDVFDKNSKHECWENEKKIFPHYPVKPSLIDIKRAFVHINIDSFPINYGRQLQCFYLEKYQLNSGDNIKKYLYENKYTSNLSITLSKELRKASIKARLCGYNPHNFGQDIMYINKTINKLTFTKIIKNHLYLLINKAFNLCGLSIIKREKKIWPITLKKHYEIELKSEWVKKEFKNNE